MTTPIRRQYLEIKRRYPQAIVFFRLGDFYETFDEDAETVARELEIVLTSRPVGKGQRVPLAGIPHHALDGYLARLVQKGYKVALCEQMEPPGKGRKLVDRQVVRVVTPGTLVEDNLLSREQNNYLAALITENGRSGLAYVDVSTGEFACAETGEEQSMSELERLQPAEVLLPEGSSVPVRLSGAALTQLAPEAFRPETALPRLLKHFGAPSLEGLGLEGAALAARAGGLVLGYLGESQRSVLGHITRVVLYRPGGFMALDANTRRNLELFQALRSEAEGGRTLYSVLNHTKCPMGARLLRRWLGQPLLDVEAIQRRQEAVQFFSDSAVRRGKMAALLAKMPDMERLLARISAAAASSIPASLAADLLGLRRGLELVPGIIARLGEEAQEGHAAREEMLRGLSPCEEAVGLIARAIGDDLRGGEVIRPGFSEELDGLRITAQDARAFLAQLEERERARTGIRSLKVGYNKIVGYYIEITKANLKNVPEDYRRRQTLLGAERYTTHELQEHEFRALHAQERREEVEQLLLRQVAAQVAAYSTRVLETARAVALIDVYCGLAEAAARYGYTRPEVDDGDEIVIKDGRHPVVEGMLPEHTFVPNDLALSCAREQIILLTGPNMAGKSTYLRQAALIVLMAQTGSFVPAAMARIGLVDRIFSRIGALDDIAAGRSTFMVEMLETAAILHGSTSRSLLLFDEIGRGTSTYDGMAIAQAVVEFIHNRPGVAARTLFATHYHELVQLAGLLPRVRNYNVAVAEEEGRIVFLHRILPGGADRSYGVHVAQLAGLPRAVVQRAQELLLGLESKDGHADPRSKEATVQLPLFQQGSGFLQEVAELDVDSMTPLQAITKLYELAEKARRES